ncbi:3-epi-6-deoxocathasterone 23-monooxygenase, partial [Cucurbita argyrosperma subsp. argyrosperma]
MDSLWIFVQLITAAAFICSTIIVILKASSSSKPSLPDGSLGLLFVGETLHFVSSAYSHRPDSFMDTRRRRYGKVFKSHLFGSPTIVSTDAEVNRFVLQSDAKAFVTSYPKSVTDLMGKASILLINGPLHRRIHGLIGAFFKSPHLKAQLTIDMQKFLQKSMSTWSSSQHNPIHIQDEAKNDLTLSASAVERAKQSIKNMFNMGAKRKMVKLVEEIIEGKRKKMNENLSNNRVPNDVVDILLNDGSHQVTDELIADNIIDMMIPGQDSVPILITLAIKYLSDCPLALQRLVEENMELKRLKTQLGEPLKWTDYLSLPFTQNVRVITETLRMGNIITGVMRKAVKDVEIKGYLIPKGWCVLVYFRSVHVDEEHFESPYHFNPWRWQDKDSNSLNFTPFGGGQRLCPGLELARLETSIFLHHFVTEFSGELKLLQMVSEPDTGECVSKEAGPSRKSQTPDGVPARRLALRRVDFEIPH